MFKIKVNEIESYSNFYANKTDKSDINVNELSADIIFEYNNKPIKIVTIEEKIISKHNVADLIEYQRDNITPVYGFSKEYVNTLNHKDFINVLINSLNSPENESAIRELLEQHYYKFKDSPYFNFNENIDFNDLKGMIKQSLNNKINEIDIKIKDKNIINMNLIPVIDANVYKSIKEKSLNADIKILENTGHKILEIRDIIENLVNIKSNIKSDLLNSIQNNNFIEKKFFETNKMELDKLLKKNIEVITEDIILANDSIINFPKFIKGFEEKKDVVDLVKKVVNDTDKILTNCITEMNL